MALLQRHPKLSYEDYCRLPEDRRAELIGGEFIMTPAPNIGHQTISHEIVLQLGGWVKEHQLGKVLEAPTDVILSEHDVVQPDILFIAKDRAEIIREKAIEGAPDFIIEILSFGHSERDRIIKKVLYSKYGVREYWIVDPREQTVSVFLLKKHRLQHKHTYPAGSAVASSVVHGFRLSTQEIFVP